MKMFKCIVIILGMIIGFASCGTSTTQETNNVEVVDSTVVADSIVVDSLVVDSL